MASSNNSIGGTKRTTTTTTSKRSSSFTRALPTQQALGLAPGLRPGPNATAFLSSGIPDLDKILGGGLALGSVVMVMEDPEAPHHLLLLRNFMSQGVVQNQPLLYSSPSHDPRAFLGTLPSPLSSSSSSASSSSSSSLSSKDDRREPSLDRDQMKGLRIAWQYKKYFGEEQGVDNCKDNKQFCNEFDLRKPLERQILASQHINCFSIQDSPNLSALKDQCSTFLSQLSRSG